MKYFTVPLLLALLSVALCAKAALGEDPAICNTTCQCFSPGQPLPFATTHTPRSIPEKASTIKLASNSEAAQALIQNPAIWALTFTYFFKYQLEDAIVKKSMYESLPHLQDWYKYTYYDGGVKGAYAGYVTENTWSRFRIVNYNNDLTFKMITNEVPYISLACVLCRDDNSADYRTYTFTGKSRIVNPDIFEKDEVLMCVWGGYIETHPPRCSDDCGTNVECRHRTVKSIGAIVLTGKKDNLKVDWLPNGENFMNAFLEETDALQNDSVQTAYDLYREYLNKYNFKDF